MTQYKERVAKQKEIIRAEQWGRQVKYIHCHNGILEIAYNSGEKHFEETATGKKWKTGVDISKEALVDKWGRYMNDISIGRDPNGV